MATVEQHVPQTHNGVADGAEGIPVENPATGETVATVPDLGAAEVAEMAARGRTAQPEWEADGFEGRGRVLSRAQKWLMDNAERVVETIAGEIDRHEADVAGDLLQRRDARALHALRIRVVDLEHGGVAQLLHPPTGPLRVRHPHTRLQTSLAQIQRRHPLHHQIGIIDVIHAQFLPSQPVT